MDKINKLLIKYWKSIDIPIRKGPDKAIKNSQIKLPDDFIKFYQEVDGMYSLYPNDYDQNGFLFYPFESLITMQNEFSLDEETQFGSIIIFSDYMLKCWYYGFELNEDGSYTIGIIPNANKFKVITNSLEEFIALYIEDSEILYEHI